MDKPKKFITTRMARTMVLATRAVEMTSKDFILHRLMPMGEGREKNVISLDDLIGQAFNGYEKLQDEARQTNWDSLSDRNDQRSLDHYLRHDAAHPAATSDQFG